MAASDALDTILTDAATVLGIVGFFWPPAAILAKLAGYAAEAEPVAVEAWNTLGAHQQAGDLSQAHLASATAVVTAIDAHRASGRAGAYSPG